MKKLVLFLALIAAIISVSAQSSPKQIFLLKMGPSVNMYCNGLDSTLIKISENDTVIIDKTNTIAPLLLSLNRLSERLNDGLWAIDITTENGIIFTNCKIINEVPNFVIRLDDGAYQYPSIMKTSDYVKNLKQEMNENNKKDARIIGILLGVILSLLIFFSFHSKKTYGK